ncbi:MAG TPA: FecR family protein, partial [Candidatus Polarisedimenticolaceae bacterium]|nr:FecR family protein [Candidatus Polarisedimenticolaceae bacterium]
VAAAGPVDTRLTETGSWAQVRRGDDLVVQSHVRTGRRGRATLTRNASIVLVDPDSELVLPAGGPEGNGPVMQNSGSVAYRIDGRYNKNFRVVTPYLVAGVKGTVFLVSVSEGRASVSVEEGTVEVTSRLSGERRDVTRGETLLLQASEGAEMELVRHDARERDGVSRDTLRLVESESRRLDAAVDRMDVDEPTRDVADAPDAAIDAAEDVLDDAVDAATALLDGEDDRRGDDPAKTDDSCVEHLLDPVEEFIDGILRGGGSNSGPGSSSSGSSGP